MDKWITQGYQYLELAKAQLEKEPWDSNLANYMVRDLEATEKADLSDLSWSIHRNVSSANEVRFLLEELERALNEATNEN